MAAENLLGEFLRARRSEMRPEDVGLRCAGRRRVPGLRREEIAMLANVSPDYYVRLEQGRQFPSHPVIQALATALRLDDRATAHLHELALPKTEPTRRRRDADQVALSLQVLIDQWTLNPAWVSDRRADVVAANALAMAINPTCRVGGNMIRDAFRRETEMRTILVDYDEIMADAVASLRARAGAHLHDPYVAEFIRQLAAECPYFAQIWARREVRFHSEQLKRNRHPEVGRMDFHCESVTVNDTEGYIMTVFYAEPGSESATRVSALSAMIQAADEPFQRHPGG